MAGVVLAFLSSIFWGTSDFVGGVSSRKSTALRATLWSFVGAVIVSTIALLAVPWEASSTAITAGVLAGAFAVGGFLALYASLATASMGVVTVIVGAAEAIVPVVVGLLWHHDSLSVLAWCGVAIALAGATLIGMAEGASGTASWQPLALALVSGMLFGGSLVALDAAPVDSGLVTPTMEVVVGLALLLVIALAIARIGAVGRAAHSIGITSGTADPSRKALGWGLIAGAFLAVANITLLLALRNGQLSVVGVVLCLYPVTTAILARVFLHERLTRKHILGITVAIAGCVLLAVA